MKASMKDRLLGLTRKIHSVEIGGDTYYYQHLKVNQRQIVMNYKDLEQDASIFIMGVCDEEGNQLFTLEEMDAVLTLPNNIVAGLVTAIITGDEKKPLG